MESQISNLPIYHLPQLSANQIVNPQSHINPYLYQDSKDSGLKMQGTIKRRNRLKPHQTQTLTQAFLDNPRPTPEYRLRLSQEVGLKPREIQVWFQNHRAKIKKERDQPDNALPYMPLTFVGDPDILSNWSKCYPTLMGEFLSRDFNLGANGGISSTDAPCVSSDEYPSPLNHPNPSNISILANDLHKYYAQSMSYHQNLSQITTDRVPEMFSTWPTQPIGVSYDTEEGVGASFHTNLSTDQAQQTLLPVTPPQPIMSYYLSQPNVPLNGMNILTNSTQPHLNSHLVTDFDFPTTGMHPMIVDQTSPSHFVGYIGNEGSIATDSFPSGHTYDLVNYNLVVSQSSPNPIQTMNTSN